MVLNVVWNSYFILASGKRFWIIYYHFFLGKLIILLAVLYNCWWSHDTEHMENLSRFYLIILCICLIYLFHFIAKHKIQTPKTIYLLVCLLHLYSIFFSESRNIWDHPYFIPQTAALLRKLYWEWLSKGYFTSSIFFKNTLLNFKKN